MTKMKKILSVGLAGCMTASALMMGAEAANATVLVEQMSTQQLAYMDLYSVPKSLKSAILEAREEIIYGDQAWTVDGAVSIIKRDGSVEEVPEFSDLYPEWEVPEHKTVPLTLGISDEDFAGNVRSTIGFYDNVYLTIKSSIENSKPFYRFLSDGREVGAYAATMPKDKYNLGFYNENTFKDEGWLPSLEKNEGGKILAKDGVTYTVRASVPSSPSGTARMVVLPESEGGKISYWPV